MKGLSVSSFLKEEMEADPNGLLFLQENRLSQDVVRSEPTESLVHPLLPPQQSCLLFRVVIGAVRIPGTCGNFFTAIQHHLLA